MAGKQCPVCQKNVELVQSAPNMILLCKGCGTFFNALFEKVGDLVTGLDMDKLYSAPRAGPRPSPAAQTIQQPVAAPEQEKKREPDVMSILAGASRTPGLSCPQCGSESMKTLVSKVTGNTLYTCTRCGYTGTPQKNQTNTVKG